MVSNSLDQSSPECLPVLRHWILQPSCSIVTGAGMCINKERASHVSSLEREPFLQHLTSFGHLMAGPCFRLTVRMRNLITAWARLAPARKKGGGSARMPFECGKHGVEHRTECSRSDKSSTLVLKCLQGPITWVLYCRNYYAPVSFVAHLSWMLSCNGLLPYLEMSQKNVCCLASVCLVYVNLSVIAIFVLLQILLSLQVFVQACPSNLVHLFIIDNSQRD